MRREQEARIFSSKKPKMIVFDKDGTLGDCSPSLRNWCHRMTVKIQNEYQKSHSITHETSHYHTNQINTIIARLYKELGWDNLNQRLQPSAPLAAGTWGEILGIMTQVLVDSQSFDTNIAAKVLDWHDNLGNIHGNDEPLVDLPRLMTFLKERNLIVAICTSDDRRATNQCMSSWNIEGLIDVSLSTLSFYSLSCIECLAI